MKTNSRIFIERFDYFLYCLSNSSGCCDRLCYLNEITSWMKDVSRQDPWIFLKGSTDRSSYNPFSAGCYLNEITSWMRMFLVRILGFFVSRYDGSIFLCSFLGVLLSHWDNILEDTSSHLSLTSCRVLNFFCVLTIINIIFLDIWFIFTNFVV